MAQNRSSYTLSEYCAKKAGWGDFVDILLQNGENHIRKGCFPVVADDLTLMCPGSNGSTVDWLLGLVVAGWAVALLLALWILGG